MASLRASTFPFPVPQFQALDLSIA